jgi:hypothetical protein
MEFVHFLDLPCLIRVSKDLSEQALRILWKILPSPLPLLKLFKNFTLFERTWVSSDRINQTVFVLIAPSPAVHWSSVGSRMGFI